jgi:hypothetical protein
VIRIFLGLSILNRSAHYTVAITYRDPVTSPLLGVLLGATYTGTGEATVVGE